MFGLIKNRTAKHKGTESVTIYEGGWEQLIQLRNNKSLRREDEVLIVSPDHPRSLFFSASNIASVQQCRSSSVLDGNVH